MKSSLFLLGTLLIANADNLKSIALPGILVESETSPSLTQPGLDSLKKILLRLPGGIEVIDSERFKIGKSLSMSDTFYLSPGVVAQERFGSDEARISIRGSGIQRTFHGRGIRVMQDGIPLNLADGSFDMQALSPNVTQSVSVLRGANALMFGSSALGGAINYQAMTGLSGPQANSAQIDVGSFGYTNAQLSSGFKQEKFDAFAAIQALSQDGFREQSTQQNIKFFSNAGYQFGEHAETRFYLSHVITRSELPGSLTLAQLNANPSQANPSNLALNQQRDYELTRIANRTVWKNGENVNELFAAFTTKDLFHPIFEVLDQYSNDWVIGGRTTQSYDIANFKQQTQFGFLANYGEVNAAQFQNIAGKKGKRTISGEQSTKNLELYALHQAELNSHLTWTIGSGWASSQRISEKEFGNFANFRESDSRFTPQTGLLWKQSDFQVFGNISTNYEPPTFSEALTNNIANRSQTGTTWEIGTRGDIQSLHWDLTYYDASLKNEFLAIDHDNNPATSAVTYNAKKTHHRGVELAHSLKLFSDESSSNQFVWNQAYTYGDFRFDEDPSYGNKRLAGIPSQLVRGELLWKHHSGFYAGPNYEWVPVKTWIDHRNTFAAPDYHLFGFKVGQRLATGLSWYAEARNIADRRYAATSGVIENAAGLDQTQFLSGSGRGFYTGIKYQW